MISSTLIQYLAGDDISVTDINILLGNIGIGISSQPYSHTLRPDIQSSLDESVERWLHLTVGMVLTCLCNVLVILGIIYNIHFLLIPWIVLYFFGK